MVKLLHISTIKYYLSIFLYLCDFYPMCNFHNSVCCYIILVRYISKQFELIFIIRLHDLIFNNIMIKSLHNVYKHLSIFSRAYFTLSFQVKTIILAYSGILLDYNFIYLNLSFVYTGLSNSYYGY
jgi:hypothetical protein